MKSDSCKEDESTIDDDDSVVEVGCTLLIKDTNGFYSTVICEYYTNKYITRYRYLIEIISVSCRCDRNISYGLAFFLSCNYR